jgi:hypothetical protein
MIKISSPPVADIFRDSLTFRSSTFCHTVSFFDGIFAINRNTIPQGYRSIDPYNG